MLVGSLMVCELFISDLRVSVGVIVEKKKKNLCRLNVSKSMFYYRKLIILLIIMRAT